MTPTPALTVRAPTTVKCPNPECDRSFACDACLHLHLRSRYQVAYAEAFGPPVEGFVDFCDAHAACTTSMLGV